MNIEDKHTANPGNKARAVILFGALAALTAAVGCSKHSNTPEGTSQSSGVGYRPAALTSSVVSQPAPVAAVERTSSAPKPTPVRKSITYRSRDYGVSFVYPWQYGLVSAKAIESNESLRPNFGENDGQFTLVRIEIPQGFYPDTDFQSGYLTLSVNQNVGEEECAALIPGDGSKVKTDSINGTDFRWIEVDEGGDGGASKVRNYIAFVNDTCYEVELGVKTRNQRGLAREVDPDQVMRRLDAILRSVKIAPETKKVEEPRNSAVVQSQDPQP